MHCFFFFFNCTCRLWMGKKNATVVKSMDRNTKERENEKPVPAPARTRLSFPAAGGAGPGAGCFPIPPLRAAAGKTPFFPASLLCGRVPVVAPCPIAVPSELLSPQPPVSASGASGSPPQRPAGERRERAARGVPVGALNSGIPFPNHHSRIRRPSCGTEGRDQNSSAHSGLEASLS